MPVDLTKPEPGLMAAFDDFFLESFGSMAPEDAGLRYQLRAAFVAGAVFGLEHFRDPLSLLFEIKAYARAAQQCVELAQAQAAQKAN